MIYNDTMGSARFFRPPSNKVLESNKRPYSMEKIDKEGVSQMIKVDRYNNEPKLPLEYPWREAISIYWNRLAILLLIFATNILVLTTYLFLRRYPNVFLVLLIFLAIVLLFSQPTRKKISSNWISMIRNLLVGAKLMRSTLIEAQEGIKDERKVCSRRKIDRNEEKSPDG